jgi:type II secretory pathway pseudopilin PulG
MTLIEALVVLALIGIVLAVAAITLRPLESPVDTATSLAEGFLREARLHAIASTSAVRVSPAAPNRLAAASASACSATTWTSEPNLSLTLPSGVTMSPSSWQVCFSSRGVSGNNVVVTLQHPTNGSRRVEVLVGGTTRVLP